ncbi:TolC family protein [Cytophagaceae bacterium ABcell3]|nr:TolC family protein [Cytophagaceae bacterium ABcell3]
MIFNFREYRFIYITVVAVLLLAASGKAKAQGDTLTTLTFEQYFQLIIHHHPVARQAQLLSERAQQDLRIARGLLDPTINSYLSRKELDGKRYYNLWDNTLYIPTWFGADFHVGYERNLGDNVNQQVVTPSQGLGYAGITVPLGQGLIIDQRRSAIRQARLLPDLAEAEQVIQINRLLLDAAREYWNWAYFYNRFLLHDQGFELASFRANAIREQVIQGDLAAIDSVEANIEVQTRHQLRREAEVQFRNVTLSLSNFLWDEGEVPLELSENVIPDMQGSEFVTITPDSLEQLRMVASEAHPIIRTLDLRLQQLDVERQFRADRLKPRVNLTYQLLTRPQELTEQNFGNGFLTNNYRYGVSLFFPIFLRQERGQLQLTKIEQQQTTLSLQQNNREILNTIKIAYNDLQVYENLITTQQEMVNNMQRLRDGEQRRFEAGESSVFLINTREINLITAQVRLQELISNYAIARTTLAWAAGKIY